MNKLLLFFLVMTCSAWAQQDPQFTQYMFNNLYYNPGFAGMEGAPTATALFRSQWSGYQPSFNYAGGAPTSQLITFSTPVFKTKTGFGAYILNDKLGPQSNVEAQVSYAYHLNFRGTRVSIGLRGGVYSQTYNSKLYWLIDDPDPNLPDDGGKYPQMKPDLAAGVFVKREKFYAGVGLSHLIETKFDFNVGQRSTLETHAYFTGGYFYEANFDLRIQFVTLVKSDFVKTQFDLGAIAYLRDTMWGGLSFRQSEAAIVLLGWNFLKDKSLKAGYGMDVVIRDRAAKQPLSHELMVTYQLPTNPGAGKKVIRTPRYRH